MSRVESDYKTRILTLLDTLPTSRLRSVLDYMEYLMDRDIWEETRETLADERLIAQLESADIDWNNGDYKEGDYIDATGINKHVQSSSP